MSQATLCKRERNRQKDSGHRVWAVTLLLDKTDSKGEKPLDSKEEDVTMAGSVHQGDVTTANRDEALKGSEMRETIYL